MLRSTLNGKVSPLLLLSLWQHLVFCLCSLTFFRCWKGFYEDSLSTLIWFNSCFFGDKKKLSSSQSTNIWHVRYTCSAIASLTTTENQDCYCWSRFCSSVLCLASAGKFSRTHGEQHQQQSQALLGSRHRLELLLQRENLVFHAICGRASEKDAIKSLFLVMLLTNISSMVFAIIDD